MPDKAVLENELLRFVEREASSASKARLSSLYSDFRPLRTVNPDGYAANVSAWQKALAGATRGGLIPAPGHGKDHLILNTGEDLLRALETKEWGRPLALGTVIKESLEEKQIFQLPEFLTRVESVHVKHRIFTPWHILAWGLRLLGLQGGVTGEYKLPVGRFVLLHNLEEAADAIQKQMSGRDRVDRIFSRALFAAEFAGAVYSDQRLSGSDVEVALRYLARDCNAIVYDGETVKFIQPGETSAPITTEDTALASLKNLIAEQSSQVSGLSQRIEELDSVARRSLSNKNRTSALAALRSKKLAETMLTQRSDSLAQLEGISNSIRQAADQAEIVRVMEASTGVLKSLRKEIGSVEKVEEVVDDLRDEMGRVDEVNAIITNNDMGPMSAGGEVEVDEELAVLEREEVDRQDRLRDEEVARRFDALQGEPQKQKEDTPMYDSTKEQLPATASPAPRAADAVASRDHSRGVARTPSGDLEPDKSTSPSGRVVLPAE